MAFRTLYNHFQYPFMPFSLANVSATFQGYINKILAEKLDIFIIIYFDHILIYTKSKREEYMEVIWWVWDQLQKHSLYTNLKKYQFHHDKIRFLN